VSELLPIAGIGCGVGLVSLGWIITTCTKKFFALGIPIGILGLGVLTAIFK
jgi:hypothetical protein